MRRVFTLCAAVIASALLIPESASAQPKPGYLPSSTHIFPAGAQRGTTVNVRVGAECTPPGTELLLYGSGVTHSARLAHEVFNTGEVSPKRIPTLTPITYPREWPARVTVAKDAAPGVAYWRLHSAQGGTGSRPFIIGDLPEFIETQSNSTLERADRVELPVTVNGQIHGERDQDYFRFTVPAGEIVSCEVVAGRLGSLLDPIVELLDASGDSVAAKQFHIGSDPVFVHRSDSSAEYVLRISNVTFRGDPAFVYRINLRSFATGSLTPPQDLLRGSAEQLAILTATSTTPADELAGLWAAAASSQLSDSEAADQYPAQIETEPNDDQNAAASLAVPGIAYGRFQTPDDQDLIRLSVKEGQSLRLSCKAWPPGTPALPSLRILKPDLTPLSPVASATGADLSASLNWKSNGDQDVLLQLRDLRFGSLGGSDFVYRLLVEEDTPDFRVSVASDSLVVTQGGQSKLTVNVERLGNLKAPIELTAIGLPDGVTAEPSTIAANKTSGTLLLKATDDVAVQNVVINIRATTTIDESTIERTVACQHLGVDSEGVAVGSPTSERLYLSVQHKPLFRLFCSEAYLYAHRGSVFEYEMEVERLNGFTGPIHLQRGDRQNRDLDGIEIWDATIPANETATILPIHLPETMAINVQSQSQLYSQAWARFTDATGKEQSVLVLSEKRNMLRTMPTVVKLTAMDETVIAKPGDTVTCRFQLQRTSNFPGPMTLAVVNQDDSAEPVSIAAGQTEFSMPVRVPSDAKMKTPIVLLFRATGQMPDGTRLITQATVELHSAK